METEMHDHHIDYQTLNRFADGELTGRARDAVQSHLRSCAACREQVQFIRSLGDALRALPTPRPPDDLYDLLFGQKPERPTVVDFPARAATLAGSHHARRRRLATGGAAVGLALTIVLLLLTAGPDRVMAGSSTLTLERARGGAMALRYETISPLAAETSVRARIRYWIPDSLRFAQNEGGFSAVELSRSAAGTFEGVVDLPPGTVYAAAAVENLGGTYLDSDFGRFWEYLETDAEGRPTLEARRYQILAALEFNVPRAASLARDAVSEFPGQPEFWLWLLSFERTALPATDPLPSAHVARLGTLDRAARDGNSGPVEMDALSRYARFLGRADLAEYWWDQLRELYPRHDAAAQVDLQPILLSVTSTDEKLKALEEDWARVEAPTMAQLGLRYSYEFADPRLTEKWLIRHQASSWGRNLGSDTEVARRLLEAPTLWTLAERWILDLLSHSYDWVGPARRLDQSRYDLEAETHHQRAQTFISTWRAYALVEAMLSAVSLPWRCRSRRHGIRRYSCAPQRSIARSVLTVARRSCFPWRKSIRSSPWNRISPVPPTRLPTGRRIRNSLRRERPCRNGLQPGSSTNSSTTTWACGPQTGDQTTLEQVTGPGRAT